jgi:hypothetical protein
MIYTSSNPLSSKLSFILGHKSHTVHAQNMEVAALVGFCVWLRNVAQTETSTLVLCDGAFASPLTTSHLQHTALQKRSSRTCKYYFLFTV